MALPLILAGVQAGIGAAQAISGYKQKKNLKVYIIKILGTKSSCRISFINHSIFFGLNPCFL